MSATGDPGADAARARIATTLEAARRVELDRLIIGRRDPESVDALRRARDAAVAADRSVLVDDGRAAAREYVTGAFAERGFSGTWALTEMSMSVMRPADRVAVGEALADAVTADAVEDLVDGETLDALRARWERIVASTSIPDPGSIGNITSPRAAPQGRRDVRWIALGGLLAALGLGFLLGASVGGLLLLVVGLAMVRNGLHR